MIRAKTRQAQEVKLFEVFLSDENNAKYVEKVIGTVKLESDAHFHMHAINDALDTERSAGFDEGFDEGRNVGYTDGYEDGRATSDE